MGSLRIVCWGTRGLVSSPSSSTAIFGGNTPCIEIREVASNDIVVLDSGFGISNYGERLVQQKTSERLSIHILYTHFHWDHIQGLPFFQPIYLPDTELHLYSPYPKERTFENLDILFDGSYSPFEGLASMGSRITIHELGGPCQIGSLAVEFAPCDHLHTAKDPCGAYAYRFTNRTGESVCIVSDHEARPSPLNDQLVAFAKDCDLLIHDAQWTDTEYASKAGSGHSTAVQALSNAIRCNSGRTLLTHHDPSRTDRQLQQLHRELRQNPTFRSLDFEFAREELEYAVRDQLELAQKIG